MTADLVAFRRHLGQLAEGVSDELLAQWHETLQWIADQAVDQAQKRPNLQLLRSA